MTCAFGIEFVIDFFAYQFCNELQHLFAELLEHTHLQGRLLA